MDYDQILNITQKFYDKAKEDILIGFHFQKIEDFSEHIPRIAHFWELQLTGKISEPKYLPFDIIKTHSKLGLTTGMIDRWTFLFYETLSNSDLTPQEIDLWKKKVKIFEKKILTFIRTSQH
jgi:hemoglobin